MKKILKIKNKIKKLETLEDFIRFAVTQFKRNKIYFGHGTDNAQDEAVYLILSILNLPINSNEAIFKRKLTLDEKEKVLKVINDRIKKRIPTAYLTKKAYFLIVNGRIRCLLMLVNSSKKSND